jgi:hypothetical protein
MHIVANAVAYMFCTSVLWYSTGSGTACQSSISVYTRTVTDCVFIGLLVAIYSSKQLFYAAQQGHIEVVRLLIANGALATACEKTTGYSAIDVAKQVHSMLFIYAWFVFLEVSSTCLCTTSVHKCIYLVLILKCCTNSLKSKQGTLHKANAHMCAI